VFDAHTLRPPDEPDSKNPCAQLQSAWNSDGRIIEQILTLINIPLPLAELVILFRQACPKLVNVHGHGHGTGFERTAVGNGSLGVLFFIHMRR
jgi:hypothetical protein